jgi:hypothetical protein
MTPPNSAGSLHMKRRANPSGAGSAAKANRSSPPGELPIYRLLTGPDDAAFCHRVSEALALGYQLHGSPAAAFDGARIIVAQAVVWPSGFESASKARTKRRAL